MKTSSSICDMCANKTGCTRCIDLIGEMNNMLENDDREMAMLRHHRGLI